MSKVFLKYSFIFDPSDVWTNKDQFDLDLANYFQSKGWKAEIVNPQSEYADEVMVYLEKIEKLSFTKPQEQKPQKTFTDMRQNRGFDGKYKKQNA